MIRNHIRLFILMMGLWLLAQSALGQKSEEDLLFKNEMTLKLTDGSIVKGKILSYKSGESLTIKILNDQILTFDRNDISAIYNRYNIKHLRQEGVKLTRPYRFKETGKYFVVNVNAMPTTPGNSNVGNGPGIGGNIVVGKMLRRVMGFGVGIGADYYGSSSGTHIFPLFVEMRGYFYEKNVSPFYKAAVGYGFNFKDDKENITETSGGYMLDQQLGLRIGGSDNLNFLVAAGLKIQQTSYTQVFPWSEQGDYTKIDYVYKRLNFSVGVVF